MIPQLKSFFDMLPDALKYAAGLALVMLILYFCLKLTSLIGRGRGREQRYDDPEAYDKSVPNLFGASARRRKKNSAREDEKGGGSD